uniref:Uncharacterized protein n=1 Tax=Zea mays TaxID=4577 RepID=B6U995_MAIZE|nr:hypothetical protein [Zea mays]
MANARSGVAVNDECMLRSPRRLSRPLRSPRRPSRPLRWPRRPASEAVRRTRTAAADSGSGDRCLSVRAWRASRVARAGAYCSVQRERDGFSPSLRV